MVLWLFKYRTYMCHICNKNSIATIRIICTISLPTSNKILAGNAIYTPLFKKIYRKYKHLGPPVPRRMKDGSLAGTGISPSFSQFVQYILDKEANGKSLDMHWIPQSRFCTPCLANFSIYAKVNWWYNCLFICFLFLHIGPNAWTERDQSRVL